jgi:hypothetical protein
LTHHFERNYSLTRKEGTKLDNDNNNTDYARDTFLFQHLVVMFQALALQQMGKLTSPITGKVERDLHQAKITIDMLGMLQNRTEGNLDENEKKILDTVMMELRMNYIDETARAPEEEEEAQAGGDTENMKEADPEAGEEGAEPEGDA